MTNLTKHLSPAQRRALLAMAEGVILRALFLGGRPFAAVSFDDRLFPRRDTLQALDKRGLIEHGYADVFCEHRSDVKPMRAK